MAILSSMLLLFGLSIESVDTFVTDYMEQHHIPGLSACIVFDSEMIWSGSWGFQHIENAVQASESTVFMMASVSKTFTGAALMQLWEDGLFQLDHPVNDYLPFVVEHVSYPETPITFQMILTHSSGIKDNWDVMSSVYHPGDSPIPLLDFLYSYYTPGEPFYDAEKNFTTWEPGTQTRYSNMAYALMGLLVQEISGMPFDQYCNGNIFQPLGMDETAWFFADLDSTHIAMPYHWQEDHYVPYGYFGYADYPAGQLRTSTDQLCLWLSVFLNDGTCNGFSLLDSATVDLITTLQDPSLSSAMGLTWFKRDVNGRVYWEHGGADQGVRTRILFCPDGNYGIVVLTNGEANLGPVVDILFDYAENWIDLQGSIAGIYADDHLTITPNPVHGSSLIILELAAPGETLIELYDLSGRKTIGLVSAFLGPGLHSFELDMQEYPSGIFFIRSTRNGEHIHSSFISI